ncbi:unnamed protein product [Brassicogethes aeneus]|uniref:ABC transporter domain-containing protein n=1 Tax=Brassicogethes aeneus TaxID=1431903 RepID=A0A9P0FI23_BRAAE|nr:unnamed protein product [Brassicogethes aeneus]
MERKYSVPSNPEYNTILGTTSEDLHAWSIYRQNLNSDFTDSALGSTDKSPLPYGNFQLRDTTVQSILSHPRYGPKSAFGSNMYTYLKFGLPRVFPPNELNNSGTGTQDISRNTYKISIARIQNNEIHGLKEGSSGYDSSENETIQYKLNRKYRSDPDFGVKKDFFNLPLAALQQECLSEMPNKWNKNRSISEANLLTTNYNIPMQLHNMRRNSVAEFINMNNMDPSISHISKAESHISSKRRPSRMNYLNQDEDYPTFVYPHLQVCGVSMWPKLTSCIGSKQHLLINDVSFEIKGGELMVIMSTANKEGTAILDILSGNKTSIIGEILLNGQVTKADVLKSRVAYVRSNSHLCNEMSVVHTLKYHYHLRRSSKKDIKSKITLNNRVNILIEDLGLEQVRDTKVSSLTISEKLRLRVACNLLLDTDIILLDQPTGDMDIFDTFFLVEYLRNWANGKSVEALGKIVILTMHPPTYEIFTMASRILLLSAGRTMFSGKRKDMLSYFANVGYPCPSFKNPSDYYLDLVTLDDLSAEAMLESSQRIEQLADIFRHKQEPMSNPGPPSTLPATINKCNCIFQGYFIFTKAILYSQPSTFINWLTVILTSAGLSLINGAIFWDVPNTDHQLILNDRIAYHYTVMCITLWPLLLLLTLNETRRNQSSVESDIRDGLYGRTTYIVTKTILNAFSSLFIWIVYLTPSYLMSGLYLQNLKNHDGFIIYVGTMLLFLNCIQMLILLFFYLLPKNAAIISTMFIIILGFMSGYTIHFYDLPYYVTFLEYLSPTTWVLPFLLKRELSQEAILSSLGNMLCRNKQVQHQDIIVQLPCQPPNGSEVLSNLGYLGSQQKYINYNNTYLALLILYFIICLVVCIVFIVSFFPYKKSKTKISEGNNP